jgi:hypothetical protein
VPSAHTDTVPARPPARTTWALHHRVLESDDLRVVSRRLDAYEESTGVSRGTSHGGPGRL